METLSHTQIQNSHLCFMIYLQYPLEESHRMISVWRAYSSFNVQFRMNFARHQINFSKAKKKEEKDMKKEEYHQKRRHRSQHCNHLF